MAKPQKKYSEVLLRLSQDIIWAHWNRLGLNGTGGINRYSVDIEAALMAAALGSRLDGRLYEGVTGWLERYSDIVNAERLTTLIQEQNEEWTARFLGALLEQTGMPRWKGTLKKCKDLCSSSWKEIPLLLHSAKREWREQDPVLLKWGIIYDRLSSSPKMRDHSDILSHNPLFKYRYLCGTNLRADVLYLLSISHYVRIKREIDFLTTIRLAERLSCYPSTIHRIQKDFESGGFLEPISEVKQNRSAMTTWIIKEMPFLPLNTDYDLGLINWMRINDLLRALLQLASELETNESEVIAKARIQEFQTDFFPLLADHEVPLTVPHGKALGPLEKYSVEVLAEMVLSALQMFYRIICRLILIRCQECGSIFLSPIQGNLSSMINTALINNKIQCPQCQTLLLTSKPNFFYYDGLGQEQTLSFNNGFNG